MRLKPNDLPEVEKGETRQVTFKLAGAVGINSISSVTMSCDNVTFGTPAINSRDVTVLCTFDKTGTHNIMIEADLSSDEVVRGFVRAHVVDSSCNTVGNSY